jgi:5'-nucleotidase (lipoprotein e(P4) family)
MKRHLLLGATALFLLATLFLSACGTNNASTIAPSADSSTKKGDAEVVMPILYQQQAAEYRALCLQAYNIAKERVNQSKNTKTDKDSLAIITDLDETALDNSANEAQLFLDSTTYSSTEFNAWGSLKIAKAVPGSLAFFNFANDLNSKLKKKIDIFYVSNRDISLVGPTMDNMKALGFPQIIASHFLFSANPKKPSKEGRRQLIEKNHCVIVLLGDNLIDLDSTFDSDDHKLTEGERRTRVDGLSEIWGGKYIVFPNAIYGDWEGSLYNYKYPSLDETWKIRKDSLHGYKSNQ